MIPLSLAFVSAVAVTAIFFSVWSVCLDYVSRWPLLHWLHPFSSIDVLDGVISRIWRHQNTHTWAIVSIFVGRISHRLALYCRGEGGARAPPPLVFSLCRSYGMFLPILPWNWQTCATLLILQHLIVWPWFGVEHRVTGATLLSQCPRVWSTVWCGYGYLPTFQSEACK